MSESLTWIDSGDSGDVALQQRVEKRFADLVARYGLSKHDLDCVRTIDRSVVKDELRVSALQFERLRQLAQLHAVDFRVQGITSHRKFVGPLIVAAKKLLFPMLKVFLKDTLREQRAFNALVVSSLAELYSARDPADRPSK